MALSQSKATLLLLLFLELIPFGWGHQDDPDSVHSGNHGNNKSIIFESDRATLKDDEVYAGKHPNAVLDDSNPHIERIEVLYII